MQIKVGSYKTIAVSLNLSLGFVGALVAFSGLFRGGIGWDSFIDTSDSIITRSLNPDLSLEEAYAIVPGPHEFYGVLVHYLADKLNFLFTGSTDFLQPEIPSTYLWQGAINILLALVASTFLSYAIYKYTDSLVMSSGTWALLNTTPVWLGMSHVNFKDMPLAAGLTLISAGLMLLLNRKKDKLTFTPHIIIALGVFTAVGSRPGSIPLVLVLVVSGFLALLILTNLQQGDLKVLFLTYFFTLLAFFSGILSLKLINPLAQIALGQWLIDSTRLASEFPFDMPQRIAGRDFSSLDLPWWYVPTWFLAQMPILFLLIFFLSIIVFFIKFKKINFLKFITSLLKISPLLTQGLLIPLAIIFSGAVIYDAVRHLLFAWPTLVVLVLFGIKNLIERLSKDLNAKSSKLFTILLIVILTNLFASIRWAPYSYAFINPVAGYSTEKRNWDLDFWGVSAREGINRLTEIEDIKKVYVMPDGASSIPYKGIGLWRLEELNESDPFGLYVFMRWNHRIVPEKCDILFEIKRDRQTIGMGGVCPKEMPSSAN